MQKVIHQYTLDEELDEPSPKLGHLSKYPSYKELEERAQERKAAKAGRAEQRRIKREGWED